MKPTFFDFAPFDFLDLNDPWAIDGSHVDYLFANCAELPIGAKIVEIGSHRGVSTSAFIAAINHRPDLTLHCIDPVITDDLRRVVSKCDHPDNVILHEAQSTQHWEPGADLLFIDGCHEWPALYEVARALAEKCPLIIMHDTHSLKQHPDCYGAFLGWQILQSARDYDCICDNQDRDSQATWRGMGIAKRI